MLKRCLAPLRTFLLFVLASVALFMSLVKQSKDCSNLSAEQAPNYYEQPSPKLFVINASIVQTDVAISFPH